MDKQKKIDIIKQFQKEIILLGQIGGLLGWDQQTYMPKQAASGRAEQDALMSSLIHQKVTDDTFFNAIQQLQKEKLDPRTQKLVEKTAKDLQKSRKLPPEFVEELSRTTSLAFTAWLEAREKNDFKIFQPHLEKVVALKRKQADYLALYPHRYNSLLDDYEEGMTIEKLKPFFEELKGGLLKLLEKIKISKQYKNQKINLLNKKFPKEMQVELATDVFRRIGLPEQSSRIDFAEHPFETRLGVNDIRITTNVRSDPLFSFTSTIHEAGHALYEMHLSEKARYDFLESSPSHGMHESQSRFWELFIGGSKAFWNFYFPQFNKKFDLKTSMENWYNEINQVEPSLIRIESDEVHYCLHIILRFELEVGLLEGSIQVKDLPKLWNEKMQTYFGITPKTDKEGVLQDVHWSGGSLGYFPTYAIGTVYASQLYAALKKNLPAIEKDIQKGDFSKIREWLKQNLHVHGAFYLADDLIKKTTGEGLNPKIFIDYLNEKYKEIYKF
ncbi:MAG: hypothetical protein RL557_908 [archaeon]|jgi:carboxypeptidase Taq